MNIKKENLSDIAIKNSFYALSFAGVNKIGGLILTIILARLLLPELFGIYSLVLSIVVITVILADFGADVTSIRYMSKALERNNKKLTRSIFRFLLKIKSLVVIVFIIVILLLAKPLSESFFNKPLLFLPLVFSCFYIFFESIRSFFSTPFTAKKDLKVLLPLEIVFQASKITLSLMALYILSDGLKVAGIFMALGISTLIFISLEILALWRKDKKILFGKRAKVDKSKLLRYMWFTGIAGITLIFFGSVDTLMLGKFVDAEYLGYYRAALGLVISLAAILPFSGTLLPIFTQIHGKRLDRGFKKSFDYLIIMIIPMAIGLMFLSKYVISLIYGNAYLPSASVLLVLSFLVIISPLIALFSTVFQAKEKPKTLAKFMFLSLALNVILNYIFIKILLGVGAEYAMLGAAGATLISNLFFLIVLIKKTKSQFNLEMDKKLILKSIFSAGIMTIFLLFFNKLLNITLLTGLLEVSLGALIYFFVLFSIKGITKSDIELIKKVIRRKKNPL